MKEFTNHIFSCKGIKLSEYTDRANYHELEHRVEEDNKNININLNKFVSGIYRLNNRLKDLLEIAGYIFAADRTTYRGRPNDLEYHSWSRSFEIHIGIRDYTFWNRADVQKLLEEALCFMTGDHAYKFKFYKSGNDWPTNLFDDENFKINTPEKLKVALFSGGIDSLAGAIETLETTKEELCLVSHHSGLPGTKNTQKILFNELKNNYKDRVSHYKFTCGLTNDTKAKDETQRTRSFLYTSIAFAIAKTYKQNCMYVFENGVTSLNFAETQDQMNARASRTTHPQTLAKMAELFTAIAEDKFYIHNPYLLKTKTDVVEIIKQHNKLDSFDSSVSCGTSRGKAAGYTHCGTCSQCIDRRFAVFSAEVEKYDNAGLYSFDFLERDLEDERIRKGITDYIRVAKKFGEQHLDDWYEERGSEILEIYEYIDEKDDEDKIEVIYNLCRKHALHVEQSIKNMQFKYDKIFKPASPLSFFNVIIGKREYLKEDTVDKEEFSSIKEVPSRGLKKLAKETCENLIKKNVITEVLTETKTKRRISKLVVSELEKNKYGLSGSNKNSISDYFRKLELQLMQKNGKLYVTDNKAHF